MFNDIALFNPDFRIDCRDFKTSKELYEIMRQKGPVLMYVYGMCYFKSPLLLDFIKVGRSSPELGEKREYQVGERIVRQSASLKGWNEKRRRSGHGAEFWPNIKDTCIPTNILPHNFNKNDLYIAIWDISKRLPFADLQLSDEDRATGWAEGILAKQYKNSYYRLPPLNYRDPSHSIAFKKPWVSKTSLGQFQVVDNNA